MNQGAGFNPIEIRVRDPRRDFKVQLNFAIPDPTVPEVRQYRKGVVGPDFFSFSSFLILSNNTEFAINGKFGNNR